MKKIIALALVMLLAFAVVGCSKEPAHDHDHDHESEIASNTTHTTKPLANAPEFSYEEDKETYSKVAKTEGFKNTEKATVTTVQEAILLAQKERTIESDSVNMFYDAKADVCKVIFYTEGVAGKDQTVYFDKDGKTIMMVYGE